MRLVSRKSSLAGAVRIPASKSHTVRAVLLGALAGGECVIRDPLDSHDTRSALAAARGLGAEVAEENRELWRVCGVDGRPEARGQTIDVGNSGTTLYLALAAAALSRGGSVRFDGDAQIRRRSAKNLLGSLNDLGAWHACDGGEGCCPLELRGTLRGGATTIECPTSQYLSALLIAAPLAEGDTSIDVPLLYERPYVGMTLRWLDDLEISLNYAPDLSRFEIPGGQRLPAFDRAMPGDFSSATFFLVAAAITGSELLLRGLDLDDAQGDKAVVDYLRRMGADIAAVDGGLLVRKGDGLRGAELDLNATPDALPALAVAACFAEGETSLGNVPQARIKETDRIAVMAAELANLGAYVEELPDGLVVHGGGLDGGKVCGHGDHRVVMAFAVAGLAARGEVEVDTAEAAAVTFPDFAELLRAVGGAVEALD